MSSRVDEFSRELDVAFAQTIGLDGLQWVMAPLLRLLVRGRPVAVEELANVTGRSVNVVRRAIARLPNAELDEQGRVVGYGITMRPTPHRFVVDGQHLYTWCALDALMFPVVLGKTAQVESPCRGTGTPVRLSVVPGGVTRVDPAGSVVSIVTPSNVSAIRSSFCNHVHFFVSERAAAGWLADNAAGSVVAVADAYELGRRLAIARFADRCGASCC